MGIVGGTYKPPNYWTGKPRWPLKDCECGATQTNHDVYTIFVGSNIGFWVIKCRNCGKIVRGQTQKEATDKWNGDDIDSFI